MMRILTVTAGFVGLLGGVATLMAAPPVDERPAGISFPAAPADVQPWTITIYWENDGTFAKPNKPTDRHYTNGMALAVAGRAPWADGFADVVPGLGAQFDPSRTGAGVMAGQLIFTPEDTDTRTLIPGDRPYAGYLFAGLYVQRAGEHVMDHLQLDLGLVGPSAGGETVQRGIHDWRNVSEPEGWGNQLRDETTVQVYGRRKWRIGPEWVRDGGFAGELIPQVGFALGTVHRHLEGGVLLRIGWNLPDDFGPARLDNPGYALARSAPGWSAYGYLGGSGRVVEHNLFIEGNTWRDSHSRNARPLVGQVRAGVVLRYQWEIGAIEVGYSQTFLSDEFENQEDTDSFGSVTVAMAMAF
jgi:hypothetical protein